MNYKSMIPTFLIAVYIAIILLWIGWWEMLNTPLGILLWTVATVLGILFSRILKRRFLFVTSVFVSFLGLLAIFITFIQTSMS